MDFREPHAAIRYDNYLKSTEAFVTPKDKSMLIGYASLEWKTLNYGRSREWGTEKPIAF